MTEQTMPTREEIAKALYETSIANHEAKRGDYDEDEESPSSCPTWEELDADDREYPYFEADAVLQLLAQRQQPPQAVAIDEALARRVRELCGESMGDDVGAQTMLRALQHVLGGSVCPSVPQAVDDYAQASLRADLADMEEQRDAALRDLAEAREQLERCQVSCQAAIRQAEDSQRLREEAREELHEYVTKWDQRESELLDVKEQLAAKEAERSEAVRYLATAQTEITNTHARLRLFRGLLGRAVKYAREDRMVTPGCTRLARVLFESEESLTETAEPAPQPVEHAKPQVTLEAMALLERLPAAFDMLCKACMTSETMFNLRVDLAIKAARMLEGTDHAAEAGKGEM